MKLIKCQWQKMMYVGGKTESRLYFFPSSGCHLSLQDMKLNKQNLFLCLKLQFSVYTQTFRSRKEFSRSSGSTELSIFCIVDEYSKFLHFFFFLMVRRHNHRLVDARQVDSNSCMSTAPKQCSKLTIRCIRCIYSFRPDLPRTETLKTREVRAKSKIRLDTVSVVL